MGIQETWAVVAKDSQSHGVNILIQFFTAYPDLQKVFKKFATVPLSDFTGNAAVGQQAKVIMDTLGSYVKVADNSGALSGAVKPLSASHKVMGIPGSHFDKIFPVIVSYIVDKAGGNRGDWEKATKAIGDAIKAGL